MVRLPWRRISPEGGDEESSEGENDDGTDEGESAGSPRESDATDEPRDPSKDEEPVVSCQFQDGKLSVYDDVLHIERASGSKFSDKWIAMNQVRGVTYTERLLIHYIQIAQTDFVNDEEGFLSTPVDENTLHLGHGKRDCARRARDAILERAPAA